MSSCCVLTRWSGRNGNNILQMVRCIYYAELYGYKRVSFPEHPFLTSKEIKIHTLKDEKNDIKKGDFFSLKSYGVGDPNPKRMREIAQKYIVPILSFNLPKQTNNENIIGIHIRSGDTFSNNPHRAYVPCPLKFYKTIIKDYEEGYIVYEDSKNPCVKILTKEHTSQSKDVITDIQTLCSFRNIGIGFGTFGFMIYLLSMCVECVWLPDYVRDELPLGEWGCILNVIDLPGYIKVGEWNNTPDQKLRMVNY